MAILHNACNSRAKAQAPLHLHQFQQSRLPPRPGLGRFHLPAFRPSRANSVKSRPLILEPAQSLRAAQPQPNARGLTIALVVGVALCRAALREFLRAQTRQSVLAVGGINAQFVDWAWGRCCRAGSCIGAGASTSSTRPKWKCTARRSRVSGSIMRAIWRCHGKCSGRGRSFWISSWTEPAT